MADYEWNLRALVKQKIKFNCANTIVSAFYTGGVSNNPEYSDVISMENKAIRKLYFSKLEICLYSNAIFRYFSEIEFIRKIIRRLFKLWLNRKYL